MLAVKVTVAVPLIEPAISLPEVSFIDTNNDVLLHRPTPLKVVLVSVIALPEQTNELPPIVPATGNGLI